MAHLRPGDPDPTSGGRDRAQLLLLAGFALAAVFVAFAFLLNSVIYTENLATRGEAAKTSQAVIVVDEAATGAEGVVGYANEHNTSSYGALDNELKSGLGDVELLLGTQYLASGAVVQVEYVTYANATWVDQSDQAENFTSATGSENWTLFDGADDARSFRIQVTDPGELEDVSILGTNGTAKNFTVEASNGSHTWTMQVYHQNTDYLGAVPENTYVVETTDIDGDRDYCTVSDGTPSDSVSSFWINVSAGTFAGEECKGLEFGGELSSIETVDFENGKQIYGTYRVMAAQNEGSFDSSNYNSTGSPPPVTNPAIYNATVHVSFETDNLFYETDRVVEPGEGDDA